MSSSLRRGALAAALALSIVPLAACAAGNDAETLRVRPDNAATSVGDIEVQNVAVLTGSTSVTARIFNNGAEEQTLDSVTVGSVRAELSGTVKLPGHSSVLLGGDGNPAAVIKSGGEAKQDGDFQKVVFQFSKTGEVPVQAIVLPAAGYWASYGPSEKASPSTTASPAESPAEGGHGTASPTATETVTESPAG
ncbi:DUF461 domain-containing protein [Streptomyces sp. NPDC026673]|uniref:DUF461 domain-containing protein n=1 Tax=Streptomyces sp. NPDC026673 TaxID=3155724 RepID=UPI0033DE2062